MQSNVIRKCVGEVNGLTEGRKSTVQVSFYGTVLRWAQSSKYGNKKWSLFHSGPFPLRLELTYSVHEWNYVYCLIRINNVLHLAGNCEHSLCNLSVTIAPVFSGLCATNDI